MNERGRAIIGTCISAACRASQVEATLRHPAPCRWSWRGSTRRTRTVGPSVLQQQRGDAAGIDGVVDRCRSRAALSRPAPIRMCSGRMAIRTGSLRCSVPVASTIARSPPSSSTSTSLPASASALTCAGPEIGLPDESCHEGRRRFFIQGLRRTQLLQLAEIEHGDADRPLSAPRSGHASRRSR